MDPQYFIKRLQKWRSGSTICAVYLERQFLSLFIPERIFSKDFFGMLSVQSLKYLSVYKSNSTYLTSDWSGCCTRVSVQRGPDINMPQARAQDRARKRKPQTELATPDPKRARRQNIQIASSGLVLKDRDQYQKR
ncbi:hypothetical protein PoB_005021800 [Plakobranchus ocellatus]|uniref:Uncharacterized protein n=1 Tax=Plakobranchus ocellatus TaxID=259542 RepID=A0AAV4BY32_9GAST|nr:hypothetical protein PoB_005021800 [Plakobranchus ocellatus]